MGSKTSRFELQAIEVHTDLARKTLGMTTTHLPESWFSFKINEDLNLWGRGLHLYTDVQNELLTSKALSFVIQGTWVPHLTPNSSKC